MVLNSGRLTGQKFDLDEKDHQGRLYFVSFRADTAHLPGPESSGNVCHPVESRRRQEILELRLI